MAAITVRRIQARPPRTINGGQVGPSLRTERPRVSKTYPGHRPFRRNRMKPGNTTAESKLTHMKSTAPPGRSRSPTRCTHADEPAANIEPAFMGSRPEHCSRHLACSQQSPARKGHLDAWWQPLLVSVESTNGTKSQ